MAKFSFEELDLSAEIMKAVKDLGFEETSPIQAKAIPFILKGSDVTGQAQTGTGKTAAFGIPMLEKIDPSKKYLQAVVLCPTRELAIQVSEEIRKLGKYKKGISVLPIYGGQPIDRQIRALKKGVQMIIGTPGRVLDHMKRKTLQMDRVEMIVLDEADEMLDMGFRDDIETVLNQMPKDKQMMLFSATMAREILEITKKYQKNPEFVKVVQKELTVPNIEQIYYEVKPNAKLEILSRLIDMYNPKLAVVFCNTKRSVDELVSRLQARGYFADALHGDLKQMQRDSVMNKFRKGVIEILVATDVAARGIDVDDVEIVFNYDIPQDTEYYVHRIGRTGRAGKTGKAITFVIGKEIYRLRDIQKYTKTKIIRQPIPLQSDLEEIKTNVFLEKIKNVMEEGRLAKYSRIVEELAEEDNDHTILDVAAALLKMSISDDDEVDETDFENTGASPGMVRLFINAGRNQNISPKDIVGSIAGETGVPGKLIGAIDVYERFTFVEVPKKYAKDILMFMKGNQIKGRKVNIELANVK